MGYVCGTRWTDELIKEKVIEVKEKLGLDRMPSRKECANYFHNDALVNAVSRRKKWYKLAEELGLEVKNSETYFGKSYEAKTEEMLNGMGFEVRKMSQNFPYDLLVDDCVKVDVKASHLYQGKTGGFYTFNLEKPYATCDFFILFAIGENEEINRIMVVPSTHVIANTQISVGENNSKYHKYTEKWDLIKCASDFWQNIR